MAPKGPSGGAAPKSPAGKPGASKPADKAGRNKPLSKRRLVRRAQELAKEAKRLLRRKGKKVSEVGVASTREALAALNGALPSRRKKIAFDRGAIEGGLTALDDLLDAHFKRFRKSVTRELIEAVAWAVGLALLIRFFLIEAFSIPSGSMIPTLEIGDHLFVNKIGYGIYWPLSPARMISWDEPDPGEIIVFEYRNERDPDHHEDDFIKRVVAIPGQRVRLVDNVIHIDGQPIPTRVIGEVDCPVFSATGGLKAVCRCQRQEETLGDAIFHSQHLIGGTDRECRRRTPNWPLQIRPSPDDYPFYTGQQDANPTWPDVTIPEGHVLVMGDNRDRSSDGRFWGLVKYEQIKGSAFLIWWADDKSRLFNWLD